jgi:molybdate transport system substrate-binding protein
VKRARNLLSSFFVAAMVLGGWVSAHAQKEISIDTPLPTKDSFEKILPGFEAKTGYKVVPKWGNGVGTKQEAEHGDPFDIFVVLPPYQEALASGNLMKNTGTTIGSFVLALTVKKGTPPPDISSAASVKKALLAAKSLVTVDPTMGSVGVACNNMLMKLGILAEVKSKIKYVPNGGGVGRSVVAGESEIGLGPYVSDLMGNRNPDLVVVGGLPRGASTPTDIVAFVATHAKDPAGAKELVKYLATPEAGQVYKEHGIMPRK